MEYYVEYYHSIAEWNKALEGITANTVRIHSFVLDGDGVTVLYQKIKRWHCTQCGMTESGV